MPTTSVNVSELRGRLSAYLSRVRAGEEVLIRDRNLAIARMIPLAKTEVSHDEHVLALAAQGLVRLPGKNLNFKSFFAIPAPSVPLTKLRAAVEAERDDDWRFLGQQRLGAPSPTCTTKWMPATTPLGCATSPADSNRGAAALNWSGLPVVFRVILRFMLKSVFVVLAGWAAVGVLVVTTDFLLTKLFPSEYVTGQRPPDYLAAVSLVTSTLYSIIGGWVTARLAKTKPWHHLLGLMIFGELMGVASAVMTWGQIQPWYQIGLLVLWAPAVCTGGWIRAGRPTFGAGRIDPVP